MEDKTKIRLAAPEVSGLWQMYNDDTLAICVLKHFLNTVEDEEVHPLIQHALDVSNGRLLVITNILNQEGLPLPQGFTDNDINMSTPKLFTDTFYLKYLINMAEIGMGAYTLVLSHVTRSDVRDFFSKAIAESVELYNKVADILVQQGTFIRGPRVEFTKKTDFIDKQSFFSGGWLSQSRPLIAREITSVFASLRFNIIGGALITGFGQVAESKKVSEYFFRGRELADKKINALSAIYNKENIPIPSSSDSFVTDSTVAPFSDKLMLYHIVILHGASMGQDGLALSTSMRHDLQALYTNSIAETGKYAENGLDILIRNQWMEQPPQLIDHKELVRF
ncbi:DUF3231 family protein [Anaerosolibacter sp.]|uniref:DUF3231 family protein n=1 Tax=Anaerosolibacter sp. TaxID=1872527 RepID=UPI0039EF59EE